MSSKGRRIVIVVVVVLLLGCAIAAGLYWAVGPAVDCRRPDEGPAESGWSTRIVKANGLERCYALYVPDSYDPAEATPLVLSLHGFLSNPNSHALITRWHKLAAEEGFLLAYPQGTQFPQQWEAGPGWGSGVDDVQFFQEMVDDVSAITNVDPARIYVNGFSNGGGMTQYLGCEAADRVAAIGTVSGAVGTMEGCEPSRPVPAMVFHGTGDTVVLFDGGEVEHAIMRRIAGRSEAPESFMAAAEWVADWAVGNGCDPTSEAMEVPGGMQGWRYTNCDDDAEVVFYAIEDGGHTWPGGLPIPMGKTSREIDATEELWRFFQEHTLDAQP